MNGIKQFGRLNNLRCGTAGGEGDAHKAKKIESNVRAGAARHAVPIRDYCSESALVVTGGDDVRS